MLTYYRDLESMGRRIHVEEAGTGHTLICLHGLGGGAWFFKGISQRLQSHCRIMAIDLPHTGKSARTVPERTGASSDFAGFSIDACVEAVVEILSSYLPGEVSLLGHSMGTMIALKVNALCPGRLGSLMFIGGLPRVTEGIRKKLTARSEEISHRGMEGMGIKIVSGVFSRHFRTQNPEEVSAFSRAMEALPPEGYRKGIAELLAADMTETISKITVPTLVFTGSEDLYAPPNVARVFASAIPSAVFQEMPGCGHMPFLEAPEAFSQAIAHFLSQTLPSSPI